MKLRGTRKQEALKGWIANECILGKQEHCCWKHTFHLYAPYSPSASVARCIQPSLMVLSRQPVAVGASESHLVVVNGDFGDSSTLQKESLPFV